MAAGRLLLPGWMPAVDSNGDPIPNAKVYFYFNKTSTLAPVYSDESLNVRIPNPVEANATGRFPAVWADGEVLYSASVEAPYGPAGVPFTYDNLSASLAAEIVLTEAAEAAANDAEVAYQNILDAIQAAQDADGDAALAGAIAGEAAARDVVADKMARALSVASVASTPTAEAIVSTPFGEFGWVAGDQSASVSADPLNGVWIAPTSDPSGASGAWKRVFSGPVDVAWFGASPAATSSVNQAAFSAAEAAAMSIGAHVHVGPGVWQLPNPMDLSYTAAYAGQGVLRFDNAQWTRRGGSSGSPLVPEHYTLFYEYANKADVSLLYDGVAQTFTWVDDYTIEASGDTTTSSLVEINIANGLRRLSVTKQTIKSYNSFDTPAPNAQPDHRSPPQSPIGYNNAYIATQTPVELTTASNSTFMGSRAGRSITTGGNNTGVGFQAGYRTTTGYSNTFIGAVAGEWNTTGYDNVMIGVSANSHNTTGYQNTAVGTRALSRTKQSYNTTALGFEALYGIGDQYAVAGSTAVGAMAGRLNRGDRNTLTGYRAGHGENGTQATGTDNVMAGWYAGSGLTTGGANVGIGSEALSVATTGANNVAIGYKSLVAATDASDAIAIGREALSQLITGIGSTAIGHLALSSSTAAGNTAVGYRAGNAMTTGTASTILGYEAGRFATTASNNTLVGHRAGRAATTGSDNTALGTDALQFSTTGGNNTALGRAALRLMQDANNATSITNCTGIGSGAAVSGDNQVQIGNSATTTYVYGTVQNRSDVRDKADIRDTALGLDFINALRPVDYRWDMREDYIEIDESGSVTVSEKDGSRKRTRFHHGFIAQEVQQLIASGVIDDFGGFQDHEVSGGNAVQSLGYDEMIAPLVKAIQELYAMVVTLTEKENK